MTTARIRRAPLLAARFRERPRNAVQRDRRRATRAKAPDLRAAGLRPAQELLDWLSSAGGVVVEARQVRSFTRDRAGDRR